MVPSSNGVRAGFSAVPTFSRRALSDASFDAFLLRRVGMEFLGIDPVSRHGVRVGTRDASTSRCLSARTGKKILRHLSDDIQSDSARP